MRKPIVAGNWKMHYVRNEAKLYVETIRGQIDTDKAEVVLCVPNIYISAVQKWVENTKNIKVAAQNMHYMEQGAYTGEVSAKMLKSMGVDYVIIGHSERRERFGETDLIVNLKVLNAVKHGITPIICIGESQRQRKEGRTNDVLRKQLRFALDELTQDNVVNVVIAYEPIWAIGAGEGKGATAGQAEDACKFIRCVLERKFCKATADKVHILYGGSVSASNADELFSQPNIDGGLIGGASIVLPMKEDENGKLVVDYDRPLSAEDLKDPPFVKLVAAGVKNAG